MTLCRVFPLTLLILFAALPSVDTVATDRSAGAMARAAQTFLDSLTPEQRAKAIFAFDDVERMDWHFIPRDRRGVSLKEMTAPHPR